MGIASRIVVSHVNGAAGRSDNTSVKLKWTSVLAQERHYRLEVVLLLVAYHFHSCFLRLILSSNCVLFAKALQHLALSLPVCLAFAL